MNDMILRGGYSGLARSGADLEALANAVGEPAGLQPAMKDGSLHLYLYDAIDGIVGVGPQDFVSALAGVDAPVSLHINSPGGDVFDATAISTLLREHAPGVEARIDGLAASAATRVAMGAGRVLAAPGSRFMIHRAWTLAIGDAPHMRRQADLLEAIDDELAGVYAERAGLGAGEVMDMMTAETWMTAKEALEKGFVDGLLDEPAPRSETEPERIRNTRRFADAMARLARANGA